MIIGRFLLRFILVPLGASLAILAAVLFVVVANWNRFAAVIETNRGGEEFVVALFLFGSWVVLIAAMSAAAMLTPAALGALIAEAFAIRSWIFHVANGGISAWAGLSTMVEMRKPSDFFSEPIIVVGAGIVAGFVYWAVAGWSAGFWKPVFASLPVAGPSTGTPQGVRDEKENRRVLPGDSPEVR
jgi:hypothetical protein